MAIVFNYFYIMQNSVNAPHYKEHGDTFYLISAHFCCADVGDCLSVDASPRDFNNELERIELLKSIFSSRFHDVC